MNPTTVKRGPFVARVRPICESEDTGLAMRLVRPKGEDEERWYTTVLGAHYMHEHQLAFWHRSAKADEDGDHFSNQVTVRVRRLDDRQRERLRVTVNAQGLLEHRGGGFSLADEPGKLVHTESTAERPVGTPGFAPRFGKFIFVMDDRGHIYAANALLESEAGGAKKWKADENRRLADALRRGVPLRKWVAEPPLDRERKLPEGGAACVIGWKARPIRLAKDAPKPAYLDAEDLRAARDASGSSSSTHSSRDSSDDPGDGSFVGAGKNCAGRITSGSPRYVIGLATNLQGEYEWQPSDPVGVEGIGEGGFVCDACFARKEKGTGWCVLVPLQLSELQLRAALMNVRQDGMGLANVLVALGFVTPEVASYLSGLALPHPEDVPRLIEWFHHSSFLGGKPVAGAGEMKVEHGRLVEIDDNSGHYTPHGEFLNQVLVQLQRDGADLGKLKVGVRKGGEIDRYVPLSSMKKPSKSLPWDHVLEAPGERIEDALAEIRRELKRGLPRLRKTPPTTRPSDPSAGPLPCLNVETCGGTSATSVLEPVLHEEEGDLFGQLEGWLCAECRATPRSAESPADGTARPSATS